MKQITKNDLEDILEESTSLKSISGENFTELLNVLKDQDLEKSIEQEGFTYQELIEKSQAYDVLSAPEEDSLDRSVRHTTTVLIDNEVFEKAQKVYSNTAQNRKLGRVGQPWGGRKETPRKVEQKPKGQEPPSTLGKEAFSRGSKKLLAELPKKSLMKILGKGETVDIPSLGGFNDHKLHYSVKYKGKDLVLGSLSLTDSQGKNVPISSEDKADFIEKFNEQIKKTYKF